MFRRYTSGSQTHCSQSGRTIPHLRKVCQAFLAVYLYCGTQKKSKCMYKKWRNKEVTEHRVGFIYTRCLLQRICLLEEHISHLFHLSHPLGLEYTLVAEAQELCHRNVPTSSQNSFSGILKGIKII